MAVIERKREYERAIFKAVYSAALYLRDEEIRQVVERAINRARKDLSS
jgi:hypothetical protein